MKIWNYNPGGELSGFAIQFDKNTFGLAPAGNLAALVGARTVKPNSFIEVDLPLSTGSMLASPNCAYTAQIAQLKVAMKTNLDVFYFSQPVDLKAVFDKGDKSWVSRDHFLKLWQELGEAKQAQRVYTFGSKFTTLNNQLFSKGSVSILILAYGKRYFRPSFDTTWGHSREPP